MRNSEPAPAIYPDDYTGPMGRDTEGYLVVRHSDMDVRVTECCGATATGGEDGITCRRCQHLIDVQIAAEPAPPYTRDGQVTFTGPAARGWEPVPWPVANAIAKLEEVRDHYGDNDPVKQKTVQLSMDYAIEVVKAINIHRPPQPPDPAKVARQGVRQFCRNLADAFEALAESMRDIADGRTDPE